ncbi:unnamed protein product [Orchesella dallaii]|uniref:Chitin-binding type-2 domain-containing protein n=1 Tax=Orchesella dallaii TaxID=48710 RepID=A0ABP1QY33_9HEXA
MRAVLVLLVSLAVFAAGDRAPVDWYECAGKAEGNYAHPVDCTRFLTCSNGIAAERDCAICNYDPVLCPQGRLVFDRETNQCLYANQAECRTLCDIAAGSKAVIGGKPLRF